MKLRAIITGSTGMVGKGILLECLESNEVEEVLVINRTSLGIDHPKLKEIIHKDFFDLTSIEEELVGYNACFFSLGVTSMGKDEATYTRFTYDLTLNFAKTVESRNKDMVFIYVSGLGTDSSENGRQMWANVKGKTENDLIKLNFKEIFLFRPGYIQPLKGIKSRTRAYNIGFIITKPLFPIMKALFSKSVTTTTNIGKAMIAVAMKGYTKTHLYAEDMNHLSDINT